MRPLDAFGEAWPTRARDYSEKDRGGPARGDGAMHPSILSTGRASAASRWNARGGGTRVHEAAAADAFAEPPLRIRNESGAPTPSDRMHSPAGDAMRAVGPPALDVGTKVA